MQDVFVFCNNPVDFKLAEEKKSYCCLSRTNYKIYFCLSFSKKSSLPIRRTGLSAKKRIKEKSDQSRLTVDKKMEKKL